MNEKQCSEVKKQYLLSHICDVMELKINYHKSCTLSAKLSTFTNFGTPPLPKHHTTVIHQ